MSIATELARIIQAKADLKTAINNKGGNITTEKIDQFASKITALPTPKEEETKTLTPDFSSGNQVITPTSGKVLSQVTLTKPTDLIPENIAKDKNICGVVGTLESGGGGLEYTTIKLVGADVRQVLDSADGVMISPYGVIDKNSPDEILIPKIYVPYSGYRYYLYFINIDGDTRIMTLNFKIIYDDNTIKNANFDVRVCMYDPDYNTNIDYFTLDKNVKTIEISANIIDCPF